MLEHFFKKKTIETSVEDLKNHNRTENIRTKVLNLVGYHQEKNISKSAWVKNTHTHLTKDEARYYYARSLIIHKSSRLLSAQKRVRKKKFLIHFPRNAETSMKGRKKS